jgi:hypothetical protein
MRTIVKAATIKARMNAHPTGCLVDAEMLEKMGASRVDQGDAK